MELTCVSDVHAVLEPEAYGTHLHVEQAEVEIENTGCPGPKTVRQGREREMVNTKGV